MSEPREGRFAIQKQLEQCVSAVSGCCTCIPKNVLLTWKMQIYTESISHFALICMFTDVFFFLPLEKKQKSSGVFIVQGRALFW